MSNKIVLLVVGIFAVLGALYVAMLSVAFIGIPPGARCISYPVMVVPSPNSTGLATVENDSCSPSHELRTVIYVSGQGFPAGTSEIVFAAPSTIRDAGAYSPLSLKLTWLDDSQLEVAYSRGTQLQSRAEVAGNVKLAFRELQPAY